MLEHSGSELAEVFLQAIDHIVVSNSTDLVHRAAYNRTGLFV